jgi:RecA-family ATPase
MKDEALGLPAIRAQSLEYLLAQPGPSWIVKGVLARRQFGVIYGASGSGKTFAALDLAFAIARGERWFGRRVRQGGVIYCASEGHLGLRAAAYLKKHGLLASEVPGLRVVSQTLNLRADGEPQALTSEIREAAGAGLMPNEVELVVLDTLNSMMNGGDENASEDMGDMIRAARRIMESLRCAAIFVHHSGKDASKGSRGHSSLKAALDVEIEVAGDADRIATVTKMRDGETGQQFAFRLESIDLGPDPDPMQNPENAFHHASFSR